MLAWGNSLGDLVADVSVARAGEPKMALAACYAGPLFNLLMGLGLSLSVGVLKSQDGVIDLQTGGRATYATVWTCFAFLLTSLCSAAVAVPLDGFRMRRWFGIYLFFLYAAFLATALALQFVVKN